MNHIPDQALIAQYKETRDNEVLGVLYEKYMPLVYGVALKYFKDREDSKDAVMHIFEKLTVDLIKHEVHNFRSWLHVMTRNYCLMKIRAGKTRQKVEFQKDWEESVEYTIDPHHTDDEPTESDMKALEKCLKKLSEEQRKCVNLFFLEEKSYRQVVELSGFELKKVKSYIQNGKRNLKICLEKNAA